MVTSKTQNEPRTFDVEDFLVIQKGDWETQGNNYTGTWQICPVVISGSDEPIEGIHIKIFVDDEMFEDYVIHSHPDETEDYIWKLGMEAEDETSTIAWLVDEDNDYIPKADKRRIWNSIKFPARDYRRADTGELYWIGEGYDED